MFVQFRAYVLGAVVDGDDTKGPSLGMNAMQATQCGTDYDCKRSLECHKKCVDGGEVFSCLVTVTDATRVSGVNCKHSQR